MGRKKSFGSPNPEVFTVGPVALTRDIVTQSQVDRKEETIIWGVNDDLPLRILAAVNSSPTTTSCLDKIEKFTQGAKFNDQGLMDMAINKDGMTLWELHQHICHSMACLEGFAVRFTFDNKGRVINIYPMDIESLRFKRPLNEKSREITQVVYNPYFGTEQYKREFSKTYNLWNPSQVMNQIRGEGDTFAGQVFFYGSIRKPYKFYPVPKYWTGEKWIYVDGGIQEYHKSNIDNGFFVSVLLKMIGDPNQPSKNPRYATETTGTDGIKRAGKPSKTVGEEFNEMMGRTFSGAKKGGAVMTWWAMNEKEQASVEAFPSNTNFDLVSGTFMDTIRGITIATNTPAILANLPQQASSLGSDGNAMQKAVELMQARCAPDQRTLESFYNNILFPSMAKPPQQKVKIVNYNPISVIPEIPDYLWEWMNDTEKQNFVTDNYPTIKVDVLRTVAPVAAIGPDGQPSIDADPNQEAIDSMLRKLSRSEVAKLYGHVNDYKNGRSTIEQAKVFLKPYKLTDEQMMLFLNV